jgi:hypothetical protein
MLSQSDDDEGRETLLKRQKRQKNTTMRGRVNPQHVVKLLRKEANNVVIRDKRRGQYLLNLIQNHKSFQSKRRN